MVGPIGRSNARALLTTSSSGRLVLLPKEFQNSLLRKSVMSIGRIAVLLRRYTWARRLTKSAGGESSTKRTTS